ncbi:MAG: hypothetical protein IT426_16195 [Pirellulales bacterium]|nr:hypothetical protein [Pirellulales bacterium]
MDTPIPEKTESPRIDIAGVERITLPELQRAVREADPAALLVLPRILRRVIKEDRRLAGYLYRIPHRKSYVIRRESLLEIVDCEELGVSPEEGLPDSVILLAQPAPQKLEATPSGEALLRCWRLLFHARLHLAVQQSLALGFLSPPQLRKRIQRIGEAEFEEIRAVLHQEGFLLPPRGMEDRQSTLFPTPDDAAVYEEFAAVFFELKHFAWNSLPRWFPGLRDLDAVTAALELDVNAREIFASSRPRGAPDPADRTALEEIADRAVDPDDRPQPSPHAAAAESPSAEKFRKILRRAQRPAALGNVVRAAIWRAKSLRHAPPDMIARTKAAVRDDVNRLIIRLQAALELEDVSPQPWHDTLRTLVFAAADGFWTAEGRLLYDLQKVCLDHERDVYSTHFLSWIWGCMVFLAGWLRDRIARMRKDAVPSERREIPPLRRPLPNQRDVLMSQHLRTAERRLAAVRLPEWQRKQLSELLRKAIGRVESRLRGRFRPLVRAALDEVGLKPANFPERIARDKLVEELLDRVAERGFLSIGDLRDALSRNNMKLPDFAGAKDLWYGDPLLNADRRLGDILRGVYRPAEFYLRWLQQLTLLGFGTRVGRILTKYAAVPFGGAFLIHKGLDHLLALFSQYEVHYGADDIHHYEAPLNWIPLGCLLFGLVNIESFRRFAWLALQNISRFFGNWIFLPLWRIVHSRFVQLILHSPIFRLIIRFLVKPAAWTAFIWLAFPLKGFPAWPTLAGRAAILFLSLNLLLNSRFGRTIEETVADWTVQTWQRYGLRFLLGAFWWMIDLFNLFHETVERLMYGVDEWLRFKSGDTPLFSPLKAALGTVWAAVSYVLRFCVNLLIEPQINPIKHFPVVTVSHKLLLPLIPHLGGILAAHMEKELAYTLAGAIIAGIPGVFGFLVWELKENWRLYAANRPLDLQPMIIGGHGETMGRLLKPGFHSGTIPKLFAKLRRGERKARKTGNWKTVRKQLHGFEHVEKSLRRYVERDFLALYNQSRNAESDRGGLLHLLEIEFGTNRVRLVFSRGGTDGPWAAIDFEVQSGWLLGGVERLGAASQLSASDRDELSTAILGLYKTAGAELVFQQIEAALPTPTPAYDIARRGMRIWPDASFEAEAFYEFGEADAFAPQVILGYAHRRLPILERARVLFREFVVSWRNWVAFWDAARRGIHRRDKNLLVFPVLPTDQGK